MTFESDQVEEPGAATQNAASKSSGSSIWRRLAAALETVGQKSIDVVDWLVRSVTAVPDDEDRKSFVFTAAMIALTAKMAKADGVVTPDEIDAIRDIFEVPEGEEANVRRLFNIARRDVAGFDAYAGQIRELYPHDTELLSDILDALFHVAKADGVVHEKEVVYLQTVAEIFGIEERQFDRILAGHVEGPDSNPYRILGIDPSASADEIKRRYRALVAENHPDKLIARGVPEEFIQIANDRLAKINEAYASLRKQTKL